MPLKKYSNTEVEYIFLSKDYSNVFEQNKKELIIVSLITTFSTKYLAKDIEVLLKNTIEQVESIYKKIESSEEKA